eukprot:scaffold47705_cov28-Tisochrysis_lutea.AAC.6
MWQLGRKPCRQVPVVQLFCCDAVQWIGYQIRLVALSILDPRQPCARAKSCAFIKFEETTRNAMYVCWMSRQRVAYGWRAEHVTLCARYGTRRVRTI